MTVAIVIHPLAVADIDSIDAWWRAHRQAAPDLFRSELADALDQIAESPESGTPYRRKGGLVRRVLMRSARHHVYYRFERGAVTAMVLAVWSAARRRVPLSTRE